jgi:retron-type reverse transcriptase
MKRYIHTYDDIISIENLLDAWCEFKKGKKNKVDVQEYGRHVMQNLIELHDELKNKSYTHGPYHHFVISDPKRRDIHKASVRDRVVHHAIYRQLYPFFDTTFISDSYSCRVNKGTYKAIRRFEVFTRKVSKNYTRQCFILKCDIRKFFASIDHAILLNILRERIEDKDIFWLITHVIKSFSSKNVKLSTRNCVGLPLGNLTSQLLVNIYMNELDQYVKHQLKVQYYIRYADDFVFVSSSKVYLEQVRQKVEDFLTQYLKLSLHPDKVSIATVYSGIDFLGWVHFPHHRVLRTTTKRRMVRNVNEKNMGSYVGLLSHGNTYMLSEDMKKNIYINKALKTKIIL